MSIADENENEAERLNTNENDVTKTDTVVASNKGKAGGSDVTYKQKILQTVWIFCGSFGGGASLYVRGPALLDLQHSTGTSVDQITAAVFVTIALGWALGSVVGGLVYDRYSRQLLIASAQVLAGIVVIGLPWCRHVVLLAFVVLASGAFIAAAATGLNTMLLNMWGEHAVPYLQSQEFVFSLGGVVAILILDAFVGSTPKTYSRGKFCQTGNDTESVHGYSNTSYISYEVSGISDGNRTGSDLDDITVNGTSGIASSAESGFEFAYLIIGLYLIVSSAPFFVYHFKKIDLVDKVKKDGDEVKEKTAEATAEGKFKARLQIAIVALFLLFYFGFVGTNESFYGLMTTFTVHFLCWNRTLGNLIPSVAWATTAVMQLVAIVLAKLVRPGRVMLCSVSLVMLNLLVLLLAVEQSHVVMWVCAGFYGVAAAPIFPNTLSWLNNHVEVTGTLMAIVSVSVGLGAVAIPALIGWLFETVSPMWYVYTMFICVVVCVVTLFMAALIGRRLGERTQSCKATEGDKTSGEETRALSGGKTEETSQHV